MQRQNRNQKAKRYRTENLIRDDIPVYIFRDDKKQSKLLMPYIRLSREWERDDGEEVKPCRN